mmetsp:Transcript_11679/g.18077  ORF Transcript_11679/g.18077 Transcript_11679/m.18077 type:complete len:229 (+) Transcript_11679:1646-2332(+)
MMGICTISGAAVFSADPGSPPPANHPLGSVDDTYLYSRSCSSLKSNAVCLVTVLGCPTVGCLLLNARPIVILCLPVPPGPFDALAAAAAFSCSRCCFFRFASATCSSSATSLTSAAANNALVGLMALFWSSSSSSTPKKSFSPLLRLSGTVSGEFMGEATHSHNCCPMVMSFFASSSSLCTSSIFPQRPEDTLFTMAEPENLPRPFPFSEEFAFPILSKLFSMGFQGR